MQYLLKCSLMILLFVACKGENCEVVSTRSVDWNETTELGIPSEIFSSTGGDCEATLTWDWNSNEAITVEPETGTGDVHIIVHIDTSTARYVNQAPGNDEVIHDFGSCTDYLTVKAKVTVEALGSYLIEEKEIKLESSQAFYYDYQYSFPSTLIIEISEDELLSWKEQVDSVSISFADDVVASSMKLEITPGEQACEGKLLLKATQEYWEGDFVNYSNTWATW